VPEIPAAWVACARDRNFPWPKIQFDRLHYWPSVGGIGALTSLMGARKCYHNRAATRFSQRRAQWSITLGTRFSLLSRAVNENPDFPLLLGNKVCAPPAVPRKPLRQSFLCIHEFNYLAESSPHFFFTNHVVCKLLIPKNFRLIDVKKEKKNCGKALSVIFDVKNYQNLS